MGTRIAILLPFLGGGGIERSMQRLARGFVDRGFQVDVLVSHVAEPRMLAGFLAPIRLVKLNSCALPRVPGVISTRMWQNLSLVVPIAWYLRRNDVDALLVAQAIVPAGLAHWLAGSKTRLVLRQASHHSAFATSRRPALVAFTGRMKRLVFRRATAIVANSSDSADDLARVTGFPRELIHVIFNPAADDSIISLAEEPVPPGVPISDGVPTIVSVGRLAKEKDFPTLIKAFAKVRAELECRLVIVGEGSERVGLVSLADKLRVADDLFLPGFLFNPWSIVRRADLFVLSSVYEGQPSALIEAMSLGVPVIATDCPSGPREILERGALGPLVPAGHVDAMAAMIKGLLRDRDLAMANAAAALATMDRFRLPEITKGYAEAMGFSTVGTR